MHAQHPEIAQKWDAEIRRKKKRRKKGKLTPVAKSYTRPTRNEKRNTGAALGGIATGTVASTVLQHQGHKNRFQGHHLRKMNLPSDNPWARHGVKLTRVGRVQTGLGIGLAAGAVGGTAGFVHHAEQKGNAYRAQQKQYRANAKARQEIPKSYSEPLLFMTNLNEVSKAVIRMPIRRVVDTRAPLGPNEFWHGTTKASAAKIRTEGFKLADPRSTTHRGADAVRAGQGTAKQRNTLQGRAMELQYDMPSPRTRAGRPRATGDLGAGVYATRDPRLAATFGHVLSDGDISSSFGRHHGSFNGEVMRVRVKGKIGETEEVYNPKVGPKATKEGYAAVRSPDSDMGIDQVAIPNPRNVEVVPTKTRLAPGWTNAEYGGAATVTAIGGVKGKEAYDKRYKRDHQGRFTFKKSYDEPLLFMSNLQEIAEISKSNPDSSDAHVLGTLRVLKPRRHGRAKDKKVSTWS
jgi:hypothetical protein